MNLRKSPLLVATSMMFFFGVIIAVICEVVGGPAVLMNLSIAFATAFGPLAVLSFFLKAGLEPIVKEAAIDSFDKEIARIKDEYGILDKKLSDGVDGALKVQQERCQEHTRQLIDATKTLSILKHCGVVDAFQRRAEAYKVIKEWLKDNNLKEFIFVGTSFRGLFWDKEGDPDILKLIVKRAQENPELLNDENELYLRFIFTHPAFAYLRELAEGYERPDSDKKFSIREEIIYSALLLRQAGIPERCIKFYKGTPTLFGVMTDKHVFLNPYPYKKQSYTSFGLVAEKVKGTEEYLSIYTTYKKSHFEGVWRDNSNTVKWLDDNLEDYWKAKIEDIIPEKYNHELTSSLKDLLKEIQKNSTSITH